METTNSDWPTRKVQRWEDYVSVVAEYLKANAPTTAAYVFRPTYVWRGQSDADWVLQPSLHRVLDPSTSVNDALAVELELLKAFRVRAHVHIDSRLIPHQEDLLSWWTLMQHYGVPTRMLDWTESAYVAAYFAVESNWTRDGAVYLAAGLKLADDMGRKFAHLMDSAHDLRAVMQAPDAPQAVFPFHGWRLNDREVAQQGRFTVATRMLDSQQEIIFKALYDGDVPNPSADLLRIIIPAALKPEFLIHLRSMNVMASALFPGADGLGRSLAELARLTSAVASGTLKPELPSRLRPNE